MIDSRTKIYLLRVLQKLCLMPLILFSTEAFDAIRYVVPFFGCVPTTQIIRIIVSVLVFCHLTISLSIVLPPDSPITAFPVIEGSRIVKLTSNELIRELLALIFFFFL